MRVLLIMGHPREGSLCAGLADAYRTGAQAAGVELRELRLDRLRFDPHVRCAAFHDQESEPDVVLAREALSWAEHLVIVYPLWWGMMPALLKGFLDRLLAPGFAFAERPGGHGFRGLLHGRSAHLLVTMDTPVWAYRLVLRTPGVTALRRDVLGFCGIAPVETTFFGPVKHAPAARLQGWLRRGEAAGRALPHALGWCTRTRSAIVAWLAALRLQFHPMTWLAYSVGALAVSPAIAMDGRAYLYGYLGVFLLEVATIFINELVDAPGDRRNLNDGPFNGGSRVLVDRRLGPRQLQGGVVVAVVLSAVFLALACHQADLSAAFAVPLLVVAAVLCLGYTAPPLRLCYRGLGELDVGLTNGLLVVLLGWLFQGGAWSDPLPWAIGVPLSLAILPAIVLANIPDRAADGAVGKRTLPVRLGNRRAALLAAALGLLAAIVAVVMELHPASGGLLYGITPLVLLHSVVLWWMIRRYLLAGAADGRLDGPIVVALAFMIWFVAVPLIHLS
jgi:putative NADPH-quinone reductase/1,4-dihydroxy-2-naphthoate octaprenyltransferase